MGPLTVFCPNNRRPIDTGVQTDWSTILRIRTRTVRVLCPECGEHHELRVSEGHLARAEIASTAMQLPESPRLQRLVHLVQSAFR